MSPETDSGDGRGAEEELVRYREGLFAKKKGVRRYIGPKRVVLLVLFVALVFYAWSLYQRGVISPDILVKWIEVYPKLSFVVFSLLYACSAIAALPTLPFNLAAGMFWGPLLGGVLATVGSTLGAIASFFAARFLFGQPLAERYDHRLVDWLQREFDEKGWRFIAFVRMNPVFPTGPLNYVLGLTSISAVTYSWATALFLFPPSLAFAILGDEVGSFVLEGESADFVRGVVAVSAAVSLLVALRFAGKYMQQQNKRMDYK